MKIVSITGDRVVVDLNPWQAAWLGRACRVAAHQAFEGEPEVIGAPDRPDAKTRESMTGYLYDAMAAAFEALATAAATDAHHVTREETHLDWVRRCVDTEL